MDPSLILRLATRLTLAVAVALALCLLHTTPGLAQTERGAAPIARSLFEQGVLAAKRGELPKARDLFVRSREALETTSTLLNLAIVESKLGDWPSALRRLDALDARADPQRDAAVLAKSRLIRVELRGLIGELSLTLEPADAQLSLDGNPIAIGPTGVIRLIPGAHELRAHEPGYKPRAIRIQVTKGQSLTETLRLEPVSEAGASHVPTPAEAARTLARDRAPPPRSLDRAPYAQSRTNSKFWRRALWIGGVVAVVAAGSLTYVLLRSEGPAGEAW